jgi:hypothetical protein
MEDKRGAYLQWALATDFACFLAWTRDEERRIGLLIEWNSLDDAAQALRVIRSLQGVQIPRVYGGSGAKTRRVCAMDVAVSHFARFFEATARYARKMELGAPLTVTGLSPRDQHPPKATGKVLAGLMDDGCAFANAAFAPSGTTRLLWVWNQDQDARGSPLDGMHGPSPNTDFDYGAQWSRQELDQHVVDAGGSHEGAYRRAALPSVARAAAHGTHVMDLLAGREPWDIVFVQFPQACVDDPSGIWLDRYALDGLHYILECKGAETEVVVVNISWGPQTGPHDGSSPLEIAIADLVASERSAGRELIVSLAAGNGYSARAHAVMDEAAGGCVDWMVPPDGATPAFIEVWWPKSVPPSAARLRLRSPSGRVIGVVPGASAPSPGEFCVLTQPPGQGAMALLVVNPTGGFGAVSRGEHGRWRLDFGAGTCPGEPIDIYVGRADHNMGRPRRARASYLTDDAATAARFVAPARQDDEAAGSAIRRAGTLSGIATGRESKVAAGFRFAQFGCAAYSSSGGSRGSRGRPDYACVTDRSPALPGVRAAGVRSGTTFTLVGTSTAAPQLGRQFANGGPALYLPYPPQPPAPSQRVGSGCSFPDDDLIHPA